MRFNPSGFVCRLERKTKTKNETAFCSANHGSQQPRSQEAYRRGAILAHSQQSMRSTIGRIAARHGRGPGGRRPSPGPLSPACPWRRDDDRDSDARPYHATPPREVLPLILGGVLVGSAVYGYRALNQMDEDWEEYRVACEEYRRETGIDLLNGEGGEDGGQGGSTTAPEEDGGVASHFTQGTLALDLGTSRLKVSHRPFPAPSTPSSSSPADPSVTVDREGYRYTPSVVWTGPDGAETLVGRPAEARLHDARGGKAARPLELLEGGQATDDGGRGIESLLRSAASDALSGVLGGGPSTGNASSDEPIFVLDRSVAAGGSYNVRPVFTYPPIPDGLDAYRAIAGGLTSPPGIADFVLQPVACVAGAELLGLLPAAAPSGGPVVVVDVGGTRTWVSTVAGCGREVLSSTPLEFGGDTFVDLLVGHLIRDFYGDGASSKREDAVDTRQELDDPAALARLYEASAAAVIELSSKTRTDVDVPYLSMDPETRKPRHLNAGVARGVVQAEFESWARTALVPRLESRGDGALSAALPRPTDLASLLSSVLMSAMEGTGLTPMSIRAVLLVGGGSRIPLVRTSVGEAVARLAGDAYCRERLVVPENELAEEIGVLGAAVI